MRSPTTGRAIHALCLVPLVWLAGRAALGDLGANPIETVNRFLGDWALRLLLLTLAVTPLKRFGFPLLAPHRRKLGLFAFLYAVLHVTSYVVLDQFFDWSAIGRDILKRPYITIGMGVLTILAALAATSTDAMVRRLGGARWRNLHRLVYVAAVGGVIHFLLMVKLDLREPLILGGILFLLLVARVPRPRSNRA